MDLISPTATDGTGSMPTRFVTVVSGYPRSGTSLMMQMLCAGGMELLTDDHKAADEHNPRGYFEYAPALRLGSGGQATDWVRQALGRAVKVIIYQLRHLPTAFDYRVIVMRRAVAELVASSNEMTCRQGHNTFDERNRVKFETGYPFYEAWLLKQPHMRPLLVDYGDLLGEPTSQVARLRDFLGIHLAADPMAAVVDQTLYRHRS